jgi:hypothetical protein
MGCMLCFQCGLHANREFLEDTAWEHLKLHLDLDHAKAHSSKDEFCAVLFFFSLHMSKCPVVLAD